MIYDIKIITDFCIKYRRGKAFVDWTVDEIKGTVEMAVMFGTYCVVADSTGNIDGVVIGQPAVGANRIHIVAAIKIPTAKNVMSRAFEKFRKHYQCDFTAMRHGKVIPITHDYLNKVAKLA